MRRENGGKVRALVFLAGSAGGVLAVPVEALDCFADVGDAHFVGFVGLLPLGVVPCVEAKLVPHLKVRKHFFKVFSGRA
jgi:hypothetical protein